MAKSKTEKQLADWSADCEKKREAGEDYEIWMGQKIPVLGITGDMNSGKTTFGISIDPHRTLAYGFECGLDSYESVGIEHVNMRNEMLAKTRDEYQPKDIFIEWLNRIRKVDPGKYSVILVDTIGDIEAGLPDYVAGLHSKYGFKTRDSFKATKGIFHKHVDEFWKQVVADVQARCQTFVYTSHLKTKWVDGHPTKKQEPEGRRGLAKLTSVMLWLQREPNSIKPPSAEVMKARLSVPKVDSKTGRIMHLQCLPPRMPEADPYSLRKYILDPVGLRKSVDGDEQQHSSDYVLSEDERLQTELQISENRLAEAQLRSEMVGTRKPQAPTTGNAGGDSGAGQDKNQPPVSRDSQASKPPAGKPAPNGAKNGPKGQPNGTKPNGSKPASNGDKPASERKVTKDEVQVMANLRESLGIAKPDWDTMISKWGVTTAWDLTGEQGAAVTSYLRDSLARLKKQQEDETPESKEAREWTEEALAPSPKPAPTAPAAPSAK